MSLENHRLYEILKNIKIQSFPNHGETCINELNCYRFGWRQQERGKLQTMLDNHNCEITQMQNEQRRQGQERERER
eukprot:3697845-Amphidinium_carterae.1